jgi:hypothetical protein
MFAGATWKVRSISEKLSITGQVNLDESTQRVSNSVRTMTEDMYLCPFSHLRRQ